MAILNTSSLSTEDFATLINDALDGKHNVHQHVVFARFSDTSEYDYGTSQTKWTAARRASLQGDASSLRAEVSQLLRAELGQHPTRLAKSAQRSGGGVAQGSAFVRRERQPNAVEVTGIHYGRERTPVLSGARYGPGIRGAEAQRLANSTDPRIKRRVYFYLAGGETLPRPEANLGPHTYRAQLGNIFDGAVWDPRVNLNGTANELESSILDAGYDGYLSRRMNMVVVLDTDVPVEYLGQRAPESRTIADLTKSAPQTYNEGTQSPTDTRIFLST